VNACFIDLATMSTIYTCNKLSSEGSYNCLLPNWESVILRVVVMDIGRHGSRASLRAQSENSTSSPFSPWSDPSASLTLARYRSLSTRSQLLLDTTPAAKGSLTLQNAPATHDAAAVVHGTITPWTLWRQLHCKSAMC
jgi:hypothetical protein